MKKHIPNSITCMNIACGSLAIVFALEGHLITAVVLMFLAAVFDFFDGFSARLLKAYSPMGKELDSLADMVSFGVVPGTLVYSLLRYHLLGSFAPITEVMSSTYAPLFLFALIIPIFSGLRLAKFNVDERQTSSFIGLNTPANSLFWGAMVVINEYGTKTTVNEILFHPATIIILAIVFAYMLVAEVPMFSFKFSDYSWKNNKIRYLFLLSIIPIIVLFNVYGLPLVIISYILLSVITS